jgi:hypothetical protein
MRILQFLFSSFIIIAIISSVGFLIGREVLLLVGSSKLNSSLSQLVFFSKNGGSYIKACREKGTPIDVNAIARLQLRFTSDQDYVAEVVCTQFEFDPIVINTNKLPFLVKKKPGSAGVIFGGDRSAVSIEVLGRSKTIGIENREIISIASNSQLGVTPQSTCQGFGYICCQTETITGVGEAYTQVSDCPKSCYAQCAPRPVVLSFSSDPFPDTKSRIVAIGPGESVSFSFISSYVERLPARTELDFGDGQTQDFNGLMGDASHTYQCKSSVCTYIAKVKTSVTTKNGTIESAETPVTKLNIIVRP